MQEKIEQKAAVITNTAHAYQKFKIYNSINNHKYYQNLSNNKTRTGQKHQAQKCPDQNYYTNLLHLALESLLRTCILPLGLENSKINIKILACQIYL